MGGRGRGKGGKGGLLTVGGGGGRGRAVDGGWGGRSPNVCPANEDKVRWKMSTNQQMLGVWNHPLTKNRKISWSVDIFTTCCSN